MVNSQHSVLASLRKIRRKKQGKWDLYFKLIYVLRTLFSPFKNAKGLMVNKEKNGDDINLGFKKTVKKGYFYVYTYPLYFEVEITAKEYNNRTIIINIGIVK